MYENEGRGYMKLSKFNRGVLHIFMVALLMVSFLPVTVLGNDNLNTVTSSSTTVEKDANSNMIDVNISQDEAIEIAKKMITEKDVEGLIGPNAYSRYESSSYAKRTVWSITWRANPPKNIYISFSIDATNGEILNYSYNDSEHKDFKFPPKVKYEDAVVIAENLLTKLYGDKVKNFQLDNNINSKKSLHNPNNLYQLRFIQLVNGVPFSSNAININIDGNGKVKNLYYSRYNNVIFEENKDTLTKEQIQQILNQNIQMRLVYIINYQDLRENKDTNIKVAYQPSFSFYNIDAKTGKFIDYQGNEIDTHLSTEPLAASKQEEPAKKLEKPLTKEEVINKLKEYIVLPDDVTISSIYNDNSFGKNIWRAMFQYSYRNGSTGWTGFSVDADTGEVLNFDISPYLRSKINNEEANVDLDKTYPISSNQAKETALNFVKTNFKDKLHQLYETFQYSSKPDAYNPFYHFSFERRINGVVVPYNSASVTVSAETGEIVGFSLNWIDELSLPKVDHVINQEAAKDIFLNNTDLTLSYMIVNMQKYYYMNRNSQDNTEPLKAKLVYQMIRNLNQVQSSYIDAFTGKLVNSVTGEEIKEEKKTNKYTDIKGHWAEKEMTYLLEIGAMQAQDGKVLPNKKLSRGEFVNLFMKVVDSNRYPYYNDDDTQTFKDVAKDNEFYKAVEWAVQRDIIDKSEEFRPDQLITRQEVAKMIIRALGYQKIASLPNLYNLPFIDKDEIDYPGEVALVNAMGIMVGDGKKFSPNRIMTTAQAAVTLYRFLEKRYNFAPANMTN